MIHSAAATGLPPGFCVGAGQRMESDAPIVAKMGVAYGRTGPSRFFSHHDMMRFWDRATRRAGLPVRMTCGFNPRPRLVFPRPLPLGVASDAEMVEVEFSRPVDAAVVRERLSGLMVGGMSIRGVAPMPLRRKGQVVVRTEYRLKCAAEPAGVMRWTEAFLATEHCPVTRSGKSGEKTVDIRPSVTEAAASGNLITIRVDEQGPSPAKPYELLLWFAQASGLPESAFSIRVADATYALEKD